MNWLEQVEINDDDALIVVDVQYDFLEGGSLAVPDGNSIIQGINRIGKVFKEKAKRIIFTQDWHTPTHKSFASSHLGKNPFDPIEGIIGIGPILWPDHCIQGTKGAEFHHDLNQNMAHLVIRKGFNNDIDSYSAIKENDKITETGLAGYLTNAGIKRVFVTGLALDYCVNYTAQDCATKGFEVIVIHDLTRGIAPDTISNSENNMNDQGVSFVMSQNIE